MTSTRSGTSQARGSFLNEWAPLQHGCGLGYRKLDTDKKTVLANHATHQQQAQTPQTFDHLHKNHMKESGESLRIKKKSTLESLLPFKLKITIFTFVF